jgi:hypothetical protein
MSQLRGSGDPLIPDPLAFWRSTSEAALAEPNPDLAASPLFQSTRGRSREFSADRLSRKDAWAMGFAPRLP